MMLFYNVRLAGEFGIVFPVTQAFFPQGFSQGEFNFAVF